ncbi:MAG TPA: hypothetical protein VF759_13805 [Allosphingosinicella sp.]
MCEPWYNEEPAALAVPVSPNLPHLDKAFDGDQPIPAIHTQRRAEVLSVISFPDYWESIERDDDGSGPADDEPITRDHWEEALIEISSRENTRSHAQRAIIHVARFIAQQAVSGTLRTYARPIAGGLPEELSGHLWELHDPRPRIASCSFNLEDPTNPSANPTHFLFVDEEDLQKAIDGIKPTDRINLIPEPDGATARPDLYAVSTLEVAEWLKSLMADPARRSTRSLFRRDAEEKFGSRAGGEVFKRAWRQAVETYPRFSRPGVRGEA